MSKNQNYTIQIADKKEIDLICSFFNSKRIKKELNQFTYSKTIELAISRKDRNVYFIEDGGNIVACSMVWCESSILEPNEAQIRLIAVSPSYREEGLGRKLVFHSIEFARKWNKNKIIVDTLKNSNSLPFWKNLGFNSFNNWKTKNGTKMIRLHLDI